MADYTDLFRDVSYHLSCNLYVPRLRETVGEYFLHCRQISLSAIEIYLSCFIIKSQVARGDTIAGILMHVHPSGITTMLQT